MSVVEAPPGRADETRATSRSWLIAILLSFCYTIAYLDRQILSLLVEPVKRALQISDTQFGLLHGISFSIFYVAATLPLAWLADHTRRSRVMSACVAAWSLITMACGLAATFGQMMLARIGVAVGEAGLTPAALATLSDRFNQRQLSTATSFFMLAPFVGGGLALGLGGAVYQWAQSIDTSAWPIMAGVEAWQIVFFIIGALGLIPAILLLLIVDRPVATAAGRRTGPSTREVVALVLREWRIYVLFQLAMSAVMILLASYVTWLPAAIMRAHNIHEAEVGALFGPIYLLSGAVGTLSAGMVISVWARGNPAATVMRYMLVLLLLLWPVATLALQTGSLYAELAMVGVSLFLISSVTSLSSLPIQYITPRPFRAQALAIMAMVAALVGTGLGPVVAGILSDQLKGFDYPLSAALSIIAAVTIPTAALLIRIAFSEHQRRRLDLL